MLGSTPEELYSDFDVVPLADIYTIIAYYLANKPELDTYIAAYEREGQKNRAFWEARNPPLSREELIARRSGKSDQ